MAVDDGRAHVNEEESWNGREDEPHEVARQTHIEDTITLEGAERLPQALVVWRGGEWRLLLAEAWNLHVDARADLSLDLVALDHLDNLSLLLVSGREVGTNLAQVLVDVVLESHDVVCQWMAEVCLCVKQLLINKLIIYII